MLTIIALIIVFLIGFSLSRFFLGEKITVLETIPISLILGLTIMSYFILGLALISKNLDFAVFIFLIIGGIFCFLYLRKILKQKNALKKEAEKINWLEAVFLILFILLFSNILSKTLVFQDQSYKTSFAGYGDIPFHMTEVSYFNNQQPFQLKETIYSGNKLNYPFLINFLSSCFYSLNKNYTLSFQLPIFILAISGILLFYFFISRIIKKKFSRICSFLIFFAGSGLGFIKILKDNSFWTQDGLRATLNYVLHLPYSIATFYDAVFPAQNIVWANNLVMFLLHQRSTIFGFALGVLCIFLLFQKSYFLAGITAGFLPLANMHSFIAVLIVGFCFLIIALIKKEKAEISDLLKSAGIIFLISLPSLYYLFLYKKTAEKGFLVFRLGWMTETGGIGAIQRNPAGGNHFIDWLSFLWQNFGIFLPLLVISLLFLLFSRAKNWKNLVLPCLSIFLAANIIKFQPWDYDNNKIIMYFYLFSSLIIGCFLDKLNFKGANFLIAILTFFIIISGSIDILSRSFLAKPQIYELFRKKELAAADWISKNIPENQTILTSDSHLNLLDSLAGRPVFLGYPGWIWTRGIDYQGRAKIVEDILSGSSLAKDLLKNYKFDFVLIDPEELGDYSQKYNPDFFTQNFPVVFQQDNIKIYKTSNL